MHARNARSSRVGLQTDAHPGGHYSPVIAPTDSFVHPLWLSSPSAIASFEESLQVATRPCCQPDVPDVISENLSCDARAPTTTVCRAPLPVTSSASSAFLNRGWVGLPFLSAKASSQRATFVGCSHAFMFRPHSLLATLVAPTTTVSCRAVSDFSIRAIRAERALLPPHAPDMLAVRTGN
jgi:hypothetical protein